MSIEALLTSPLFKRDQAGRTIVFPNGVMRRGYFVPDTEERRMRRTLMWAKLSTMVVAGIVLPALMVGYGQMFHFALVNNPSNAEVPDLLLMFDWTAEPWIIAAAALSVVSFSYGCWAKRLVRGMTPAPATERMSRVEAFKHLAGALPRGYLWFNAISGPILLVYMGINITVMPATIAVPSLILFPALVVIIIHAFYGLRRMQAPG